MRTSMVIYVGRESGWSLETSLLDRIFRWGIDLDFDLAFWLVDFDVENFCLRYLGVWSWCDLKGVFAWVRSVFFDGDLMGLESWCCVHH